MSHHTEGLPWDVPGINGEKLSRGTAANVVAFELVANDSARTAGRASVAEASPNRSGPPRHPRVDVLQHHVLDALRAFRRALQL